MPSRAPTTCGTCSAAWWPGSTATWGAEIASSKVPSDPRAILPIGVAELPLQVALFAQDDSAMHDDENRDQQDEAPACVERERETAVQERQSHVERIAREAKRTGGDDRRGGERRIHVRARRL